MKLHHIGRESKVSHDMPCENVSFNVLPSCCLSIGVDSQEEICLEDHEETIIFNVHCNYFSTM